MRTMKWSEFSRTLKSLNSGLVLKESWGPVSQVFYFQPNHPDSNNDGYVEVLTVPTPRYHPGGLPFDDHAMVNGKRGRGANTFFKELSRFRKFGGGWLVPKRKCLSLTRPANYKELHAELRERNYSEGYKSYMKYKHLFRPYAGNGDPVGATASGKTLYSLPEA